MYQVSCFYHKMHDSSLNCYISAPLLVNLFIYDYLKDLYGLLQIIFVLIVRLMGVGWPRPLLTYYEVDKILLLLYIDSTAVQYF